MKRLMEKKILRSVPIIEKIMQPARYICISERISRLCVSGGAAFTGRCGGYNE